MTLNRQEGMRAAIWWCTGIWAVARGHKDAEVCVVPGRVVEEDTAGAIVKAFIDSDFEGGRHQRRIDKIPVTK